MKNQALFNSISRIKGITVIEILLVISLLAVLFSFAIPSVSGAAARAELTAAVENTQFSLDTARQVARISGAGIQVNFGSTPDGRLQNITFSAVNTKRSGRLADLQEYQFPEDIRVLSEHEAYLFDDRGLVDKPGEIILVSRTDESISSTLQVE